MPLEAWGQSPAGDERDDAADHKDVARNQLYDELVRVIDNE